MQTELKCMSLITRRINLYFLDELQLKRNYKNKNIIFFSPILVRNISERDRKGAKHPICKRTRHSLVCNRNTSLQARGQGIKRDFPNGSTYLRIIYAFENMIYHAHIPIHMAIMLFIMLKVLDLLKLRFLITHSPFFL